MLDLTNLQQKQGALDALRLILDSKDRAIYASDEPDGKKQTDLLMPKNAKIIKPGSSADAEGEKDKKEVDAGELKRFDDPDEIQKDLDDIMLDVRTKKAADVRQIKAAKEAEARKFAAENTLNNFSMFETDLKRAIAKQVNVASKPEDSYRKYNPTYHGSDFLMPGQMYPEKHIIPTINIYFDMSSSWDLSDTEKGREAIKSIDILRSRKKLKYNMYYFAEHVKSDPHDPDIGILTTAFPEIVEHIQKTKPTNVIIFTDSDFDGCYSNSGKVFLQTPNMSSLPYLKLRGCVWWLWRQGKKANNAFKHIQSLKPENTFQYKF